MHQQDDYLKHKYSLKELVHLKVKFHNDIPVGIQLLVIVNLLDNTVLDQDES